jgi:hypothetical protein
MSKATFYLVLSFALLAGAAGGPTPWCPNGPCQSGSASTR